MHQYPPLYIESLASLVPVKLDVSWNLLERVIGGMNNVLGMGIVDCIVL